MKILKTVLAATLIVACFSANALATTFTTDVKSKFVNKNPLLSESYATTGITSWKSCGSGYVVTRSFTETAKITMKDSSWNVQKITKQGTVTAESDSCSQCTSYHYTNIYDGSGNIGAEVTSYTARSITSTVSNK